MLVSSKNKNGIQEFQVHKEGLLFLRNFRNKRLRVVFNIAHQPCPIEKFNQNFLSQPEEPNSNAISNPSSINENSSQLWISNKFKELSQNRVLIFLNAYENGTNAELLVIGYLVASVFFYHNCEDLGEQSRLTSMLASLRRKLEGTCVHKLQEEIKYKSGCAKKPYFMCLFLKGDGSQENYHNLFREFYKYQEGKDRLNESVDALIDYFPERSAMKVTDYSVNGQSQELIRKLGQQYINGIMGRQIFNFEITGSTLQNLCFELCQVFNSNATSIDLFKIYNKIINNQKNQVLDHSTQKYSSLMTELTKNLPYEPSQLLESCQKIQKHVISQSMADACNCMIFSEYQTIYEQIQNVIEKKVKSIKDNNKELLRNRALACFQQIQQDKLLQEQFENINENNCSSTLEAIAEKIQIFLSENVHEYNVRDMAIRLVNKYVETYGQGLREMLREKDKGEKDLVERVNRLEMENKVYQAKCKELENEYMYLSCMNNEFKQKLLNSGGNNSSLNGNQGTSTLIMEFKKRIMDLQLQLTEKNQVTESLYEIVDKFDVQFNRKFYKPKFNKDIQNLLSEITHKINEIYSVFNELKKTQKFYQDIEHEFQLKKREFYKVREAQKLELAQTKEKMNQVVKEKACIEKIAQEGRNTVLTMQKVEIEYKNSINELENACSRLKCFLAETEGDFQKFKKALELTITYCTTGKIDKLRDFYKVSTEQQLKEMLKPLFKK